MPTAVQKTWIPIRGLYFRRNINISLPKKVMNSITDRGPVGYDPPSIKEAHFSLEASQLRIHIKFENLPNYPFDVQIELNLTIQSSRGINLVGFPNFNLNRKTAGLDIILPIARPLIRGHNINSIKEIKISLIEPFANRHAEICYANYIKRDGKWQ